MGLADKLENGELNGNRDNDYFEDNHLLVVENLRMFITGDRTGDPDIMTLLKEDIKFDIINQAMLSWVSTPFDRPVGESWFCKTSSGIRLSDQIRRGNLKTVWRLYMENPMYKDILVHHLLKDNKQIWCL